MTTSLAMEATLHGKVLVVDDELPIRAYLRKILTTRGCEVLEATEGAAALLLAHEQKPDLILADVMMPGMSGYELLRTAQEDEHLREIPIIMVTAQTDIEALERGFQFGAFDYIRKPFNPRELIARVRNALMLKHSVAEVREWKRRMSYELETAGSLQRNMLSPHPLFSDAFEARTAFQPSLQVGGDFFGVLPLPGGRVAAFVGDVSGHGIGPAMISTLLNAFLRGLLREQIALDPTAICNELNLRFRQHVENPELYATLFLALYDPLAEVWQCLNCGHPPPLYFPPSATTPRLLNERGEVPLGFASVHTSSYQTANEMTVPAGPGTKLLLYTDGLLEARGRDGGELGETHLMQTLATLAANETVVNLPAAIVQRFQQEGFGLGADDCSVVWLERPYPGELKLVRSIAPNHAAVAQLAQECEHVLMEDCGWTEEAATAARLLVTEHAANVVDHGQPPAGSTIKLRLAVRGATARILVCDQGLAWSTTHKSAWAAQQFPQSERGRGLGIIRSIAEHMEVFRDNNENISHYILSSRFTTDKMAGAEVQV